MHELTLIQLKKRKSCHSSNSYLFSSLKRKKKIRVQRHQLFISHPPNNFTKKWKKPYNQKITQPTPTSLISQGRISCNLWKILFIFMEKGGKKSWKEPTSGWVPNYFFSFGERVIWEECHPHWFPQNCCYMYLFIVQLRKLAVGMLDHPLRCSSRHKISGFL